MTLYNFFIFGPILTKFGTQISRTYPSLNGAGNTLDTMEMVLNRIWKQLIGPINLGYAAIGYLPPLDVPVQLII